MRLIPTRRKPPQQRRRRAVTAAGTRIGAGNADTLRRLQMPWQQRAFFYYDAIGEIKYASQFYSRSLSKLRIYAARIDDAGEVEEIPAGAQGDDAVAVAAVDRIEDPGGGRSSLLGSYGRLMFLIGEALMFVSRNPETEVEQWEMLSPDELKFDGRVYSRLRAPALGQRQYRQPSDDDYDPIDDDEAVAYRLWRRHPRFSEWPDSTMQGVLEICEELMILTRTVRSRARSRLAGSGILLLNGRYFPPPPEPVGDEDPLEDPVMADLIEAMMAPIADEGVASAVVPLLERVDVDADDSLDNVMKHIPLVDPTQLYPETGLRAECIRRIAIGLDLPPEILLGMAESNHWSAWQVDEQVWKAHLQPVAQQLVDDLTAAYFRPQLRADGVRDWQRYVIAYDAAEIINHPDRTRDAKDLYELGVLGDEALLETAGFTPDDAPTEEQKQVWLSVHARDPGFAVTGIPSRPTAEGAASVDAAERSGDNSADVRKGAPETSTDQAVPGGVIGSADVHKIIGAAELTLRRAREAAGNKLRSHAKRDPDLYGRLNGTKAGDVACRLGADACSKVGAPDARDLVKGTAAILVETLPVFGVTDAQTAGWLGDLLEQHAARTLFQERPAALPASFANYLLELQRAAR